MIVKADAIQLSDQWNIFLNVKVHLLDIIVGFGVIIVHCALVGRVLRRRHLVDQSLARV
jgi:hypothetical protein